MAEPVIEMTEARLKLIEERGYDIVPLSALQGPPPELYPRTMVNEDVVELYRENWDSYQNSPIVAELENGFVLDGNHRLLACREVALIEAKEKGQESIDEDKVTIRVKWVDTPETPLDLLLAGAKYNSKHGFSLNEDDRKKCVLWLNTNHRPKKGISAWQKNIADTFGVSDRTVREWINASVADERAERDEAIKKLLTENEQYDDNDKRKLSFQQIADKLGTTRNVVRNIRNNMIKEQRTAAQTKAPPASSGTVEKSDPTGDIEADVKKGDTRWDPNDPNDILNQPSVLDKTHPIYNEEPVASTNAMKELGEDDAVMVYDSFCKEVAVPDQENAIEAKKNFELNEDSPELKEMHSAFEQEAYTSWAFVQRLCSARVAKATNLKKWISRQTEALRRRYWEDPEIDEDNPHAAQRKHVSMQNSPIGDKTIKVSGNDKFSIFRSPIVDDGFCVGPTDTSTQLKNYYQVSGADAREQAETFLQGFTENPAAYQEYIDNIVNRPRRETPEDVPDPSEGAITADGAIAGATVSKRPKNAEEALRVLDGSVDSYQFQAKRYKRVKLRQVMLLCINFWADRDITLKLSEIKDMFNEEIDPLIEIEES